MIQTDAHFSTEDIIVGRVISEDKDFMLIEIAKDENRQLTLEPNDRFYTLVFVRMTDTGKPEFWKPWLSA